jgi:predicted mannosyl-3-phosphoglycerate phosphatase (HAD superfamily)
MPDSAERDPEHWLWRFSASEWLTAAHHELDAGAQNLASRRTTITHARRGAGMAINAVLVTMAARGWARERSENIWGRSYVEHLRMLAGADEPIREPFDADFSKLCRELLTIPVLPQAGLVQLARGKDQAAATALELATRLVEACVARIG